MKTLFNRLKGNLNQNGQGAIEYILLLVVVVAIAIAFKDPILSAVNAKVSGVAGSMATF